MRFALYSKTLNNGIVKCKVHEIRDEGMAMERTGERHIPSRMASLVNILSMC